VEHVDRDDPHALEGVVDLLSRTGIGPLWGMASMDLNATLLAWSPGHVVAEHVNGELDVLVVVVSSRAGHTAASRPTSLVCVISPSTGVAGPCRSRRHRSAE
jgi:hypothetical protein